jgi:predicted phosphodiesterase
VEDILVNHQTMFRIQYVSDLHLEFYKAADFVKLVTPSAPYLALAGDIGKPKHPLFEPFLEYVSERWSAVFYVAGNHEFYGSPAMAETTAVIRAKTAKFSNLYFLNAESPVVYLSAENVAVIGTTLWSYIPNELEAYAAAKMNDYHMIGGATTATLSALHAKEKQKLATTIDCWKSKAADIVVITHHLPSFSLINPRFADSPLNVCFASECSELLKDPAVKAWIYGHTHDAQIKRIGGTIAAVNAHGYPSEHIPGYKNNACLEFKVGEEKVYEGKAEEETEFL